MGVEDTIGTALWTLVYTLGACCVWMVWHVLRQPDPLSLSLTALGDFVNWSGRHRARPHSLVRPATTGEVAELVKSARAHGQQIRVVGAGHSWNRSAATDGIMLSLDAMDKVLDLTWIGRNGKGRLPPVSDHSADAVAYVTVEAGIRFQVLQDYLWERGLTFHALPSVAAQSAAGLIATGTHSNGPRFQCQSNYVVGLEMVDGTGEVVVVTPESEWFDAARLGLGSLGIITQLTFEVVPAFKLTKVERPVSWQYVQDHLDEILEQEEFLKLWTFPGTDTTQLYLYRRTSVETPSTVDPWTKIENVILQQYVVNAILWVTSFVPSLFGPVMRAVTSILRERVVVDRADRLFNIDVLIRHAECEIAFPVSSALDVLNDIKTTIEASGLALNLPLEIRFVAADNLWISNDYGQASMHVTACFYGSDPVPYFDVFEAVARRHGGRPHWGKYFTETHSEFASMYPRWNDFLRARDRFDPDRVLVNAWAERVLGP